MFGGEPERGDSEAKMPWGEAGGDIRCCGDRGSAPPPLLVLSLLARRSDEEYTTVPFLRAFRMHRPDGKTNKTNNRLAFTLAGG